MVLMEKACEECTRNCVQMHRKDKNPSPVATTFFKVLFGDDYSKILFLPPRFASSLQDMVGKTSWLEDSSGEKWTVKYSKVDGLLAFQEGWNRFSSDHGLKMGDFLVFHHIRETHFVVLMYGQSGCPEIRHYGFPQHLPKETNKNHKLIEADHSPSNVDTNDHHLSSQSSSQSERSIYRAIEHPKKGPSKSTRGRPKKKKIKKQTRQKRSFSATVSPDVNTTKTNTDHPMHVPSSRPGLSVSEKEKSQRSETLVNSQDLDNLISNAPTVKQCTLINNDTENVEDECRINDLNGLSVPEINSNESDGGGENNVAVGGGRDETQINGSEKVVETRSEELEKGLEESTKTPMERTYNDSIKKRLRGTNFPFAGAKIAKIEPNEIDALDSRLRDVSGPSKSTGIFSKPIGSTKTACYNSAKDEMTATVKPEPIDYDNAPPSAPTDPSFSAVMSSYQYLELPEWVKIKSNVILLRNPLDLWPLLYQNKAGLKALTQGWELFARNRGIQLGDVCEFVLESESESKFTCDVFTVHVTRK